MEVDWQMEKKKIVILEPLGVPQERLLEMIDRKSTRLNSSHAL